MKNTIAIVLLIFLFSCQEDSIESKETIQGTWYMTDAVSQSDQTGLLELMVMASGDYQSVVISNDKIVTYDKQGNLSEEVIYSMNNNQITISSAGEDRLFNVTLNEEQLVLSNDDMKYELSRNK